MLKHVFAHISNWYYDKVYDPQNIQRRRSIMSHRVITLRGDGIGHEIMPPTIELLKAVTNGNEIEFEEHLFGGASIDVHGVPLTYETLEACKGAAAVLLACVGGPKWDSADPSQPRPEQGLIALRRGLGLYANSRPVRIGHALSSYSSLENGKVEGTNLMVVRELIGGSYRGEGYLTEEEAVDVIRYTPSEVRRIAHVGFQTARQGQQDGRQPKVTSVDKANVLNTSKMWRRVVTEVAQDYKDVQLEHMLVDNAAAQILGAPKQFHTILTENGFGDILGDEAAMLNGSLGMTPSVSQGREGTPKLLEPGHGSAQDIAGKGRANPLAMFLSGALLLRGLGMEEEALAVEGAVDKALSDGLRTSDLGGDAGTKEAVKAVLSNI
jgi:3-isopropylmalate dehydrogenase